MIARFLHRNAAGDTINRRFHAIILRGKAADVVHRQLPRTVSAGIHISQRDRRFFFFLNLLGPHAIRLDQRQIVFDHDRHGRFATGIRHQLGAGLDLDLADVVHPKTAHVEIVAGNGIAGAGPLGPIHVDGTKRRGPVTVGIHNGLAVLGGYRQINRAVGVDHRRVKANRHLVHVCGSRLLFGPHAIRLDQRQIVFDHDRHGRFATGIRRQLGAGLDLDLGDVVHPKTAHVKVITGNGIAGAGPLSPVHVDGTKCRGPVTVGIHNGLAVLGSQRQIDRAVGVDHRRVKANRHLVRIRCTGRQTNRQHAEQHRQRQSDSHDVFRKNFLHIRHSSFS